MRWLAFSLWAGGAWIVAVSVACGGGGGTPGGAYDAGGSSGGSSGGDAAPGDAALADAALGDASSEADAPPRGDTPIKHVIVVVKENHTFDNYFGTFPGAEGTTSCKTTQGTIMSTPAPDSTPRDLCHDHGCALTDLDGGAMDGWLAVSGASQNGDNLFCAQYDGTSIPNYWAYAKAFGLADHYFADMLGPSFPGHTFYLAAQAGWALGNPGYTITNPYWGCDEGASYTVTVLDPMSCTSKNVAPCFTIPSVPDLLPSTVDWKFYGSNFYVFPEIWSMFDAVKGIRNGPGWAKVVNQSEFDADVDSGKLPPVTWLVNQDLNDEHPKVGGVCAGENYTVGHLNHVMQSPMWKDTVIFFTMDDFGGWYDHVVPPRQYGCDPKQPYGLGFRLPLLIISPYAKQGVYKKVAEQASIPKFILEVFKAPMLLGDIDPAAQDKQANDLMDAFDWNQAPLPPLVLQQRTCL